MFAIIALVLGPSLSFGGECLDFKGTYANSKGEVLVTESTCQTFEWSLKDSDGKVEKYRYENGVQTEGLVEGTLCKVQNPTRYSDKSPFVSKALFVACETQGASFQKVSVFQMSSEGDLVIQTLYPFGFDLSEMSLTTAPPNNAFDVSVFFRKNSFD
ncbi:hypothetical protein GW916_11960 [bacterium]|nr:hypothetical protein [bacterium]